MSGLEGAFSLRVFPYTALSLVRLWIQLLRQSTELSRVITHFLREDGLGCTSPEEYRWNVCEMTSWFPPQCLVRLRIQILRQSTETLEGAKCPLQPAVMCSVSGPREELVSLGTDYEGVKLAGPFKDGYQSY